MGVEGKRSRLLAAQRAMEDEILRPDLGQCVSDDYALTKVCLEIPWGEARRTYQLPAVPPSLRHIVNQHMPLYARAILQGARVRFCRLSDDPG
jgi:hypothetical protein